MVGQNTNTDSDILNLASFYTTSDWQIPIMVFQTLLQTYCQEVKVKSNFKKLNGKSILVSKPITHAKHV